jgi:hypothetical protein
MIDVQGIVGLSQRRRARLSLVALMTALVLAGVVSAASAQRLEVSNQGIRVVWEGENILVFSAEGLLTEVRCAVIAEGTLHSRIFSKVSGELIGFITRARVAHPCERNELWLLTGAEGLGEANTLPWHIRYDSFAGTLPNITEVRVQLIGVGFLVRVLEVSCLYRSSEVNPLYARFTVVPGGTGVTGFKLDETRSIPKASGSMLCPAQGRLSRTGRVTLLETVTVIQMRLVP